MKTKEKKKMGRFSVEFDVANNLDVGQATLGNITPDQVRKVRMSGVVDPGATRLVLPAKAVKDLGVRKVGRVKTRYADGHTAQKDYVDEVRVTLLGRSGVFDAIVEPKRETALIGAIVLETLDFLVDCTKQQLVPRDPKQIVSELE